MAELHRAAGHADAPEKASVVATQGGTMQARVFGQMLAVACYMEVFTRVAIAEPRKVCHSSYATTRQTTRVSESGSWCGCDDLAPSHLIAPSPDKMMVIQVIAHSVQHRFGVLLMLCGRHD